MTALLSLCARTRVRVHRSKEVSAVLPSSVRNLRLVLLVPRSMGVRALVAKLQKMLQLPRAPLIRVGYRANAGGEQLDEARTMGEYFEAHGDRSDGFLHVAIELRK